MVRDALLPLETIDLSPSRSFPVSFNDAVCDKFLIWYE